MTLTGSAADLAVVFVEGIVRATGWVDYLFVEDIFSHSCICAARAEEVAVRSLPALRQLIGRGGFVNLAAPQTHDERGCHVLTLRELYRDGQFLTITPRARAEHD